MVAKFSFKPLPGVSVELLLEDKRLSCSRQIIENNGYFSGYNIKHDLGENKRNKLGLSCAKLRANLIFPGLD